MEEIKKASSKDVKTSRLAISGLPSAIGYSGLSSIREVVSKEQVQALRWPRSLYTFDQMDTDPSVFIGHYLTQIMVEKVLNNYTVSFNKESDKSELAARQIKLALGRMKVPLSRSFKDAYTFKKYGFSILVKNYKNTTDSDFKELGLSYKISKLSPRNQHTLNRAEPFTMVDGEVVTVNQDWQNQESSQVFLNYNTASYSGKPHINIAVEHCMIFSYDSSSSNPLGNSPRRAAYKAYAETQLIDDYTVTGVLKDLNGVPILEAPAHILEAAHEDPTSPSGKLISGLNMDMANWHAGQQPHMMLPSDLQVGSNTVKEFNIKLAGIEGGGSKSYKTTDLIEQRRTNILNCYGAAFLTMGQGDSSGGYALGDTQKGIHAFFVENDANAILEVYNEELLPQFFSLNNIKLSHEDMPRLVLGKLDERNTDDLSKAVQRMASVSGMPIHPELVNEWLEHLGFDYRIPNDVVESEEKWEEYKSKNMGENESRAGDGMAVGKAGDGTGDGAATRDNSVSNNEN